MRPIFFVYENNDEATRALIHIHTQDGVKLQSTVIAIRPNIGREEYIANILSLLAISLYIFMKKRRVLQVTNMI
jgi:hypothetical protein